MGQLIPEVDNAACMQDPLSKRWLCAPRAIGA
jgi:hypothetical protein